MTLNKIQDFAQTKDATTFSTAIETRVENGKLAINRPSAFAAPATTRPQATAAA